ncbi:hypothetical protein ECG_03295 [Echinococcus granulosus]|nr:hypothetical protein ECG_03295 [Echinococcus granulosus]
MQVTLLDDAIKNVILKQAAFERRVYSRFELLDLKKRCKEYKPPVFIIDRFLKRKNGKDFIFHSHRNDHVSFAQYGTPTDRNRRDYLTEKPAWYTEGPKNIDDQMDFDDMKMPQFHDQAICKIECIDSSNKDKILLSLCQHVATTQEKTSEKSTNSRSVEEGPNMTVGEPFASTSGPVAKSKQKCVRIYTLREIENDLHVRKKYDDISNDLTAFNKLLAIVGFQDNDSQQQELSSDSATSNLSTAVDKGDSGEHEKVVLQALNQKDVAALSEVQASPLDSVCPPKDYTGCTTRYPTHLFNQASIGHTFRWFRAMTNAASASAFICQKMDSFNSIDSEAQRSAQNLGSLGQQCSFDSSYEDMDSDQFGDMIQPMDSYDYVSHGVPLRNSLGFPVGTGVNRIGSRVFNPMEFQNGNKFLTHQPLQPFILQRILQQQQLVKCIYLADSALQLLNLRNNTMGFLPGYQAQVHPFPYPHLTNSNAVNYPLCNQFSQHHQQQPTMTAATATNGIGEGDLGNPDASSPNSMSQVMENKHCESFPTAAEGMEC